ncbi:kinase-like domain-containing protein [Phyllosticta citrichinensis]
MMNKAFTAHKLLELAWKQRRVLQNITRKFHYSRTAFYYNTFNAAFADAEEPEQYLGQCSLYPVLLGDTIQDERYKILHKLGGPEFGLIALFSLPVFRENKYVALKICAILEGQRQEAKVMRALAASHREHPRTQHVIQMLDLFKIAGPKGQHDCFVFELHGQDVGEYFESRFSRLPDSVAKRISKEALQALDYLHKRGIVHGGMLKATSYSTRHFSDL